MRTLTWEELEDFKHWAIEHGWWRFETVDISTKTIRHFFMTPTGHEVTITELKKEESPK